MEPGQPEAKRPRINNTPPSWSNTSSHQGPVLPPPPQHASQHPSQHAQQHTALPPFQTHSLYSRPPEPPPHPAHHHHDDRRHHEQDSYPPPPPIQEHHRQPPPSPVHAPPPFPHYHRESTVKRESGEDTPLPQMRRPNSTGNAPEGLPPLALPHGLPYQSQHPDEHRRPPSFDNGPPMPQSPQVYRQPQPPNFHQPPTPVAPHSQYDASPHPYTPTAPVQDMYSSLPISSAKRKAQRASQACDSCRQLKAKCDEQRPCKNCSDKGMKCVYRDLPTKQPDKVSADILELMNSMKNQMTAEFSKMDQRMTRLEQAMKLSGHASDIKVESVEGDSQERERSPTAGIKDIPDDIPEGHASPPKETDDPPENVEAAHATLREYDEWAYYEIPVGPPVVPGQPSMPADHTTLAALLLQWPAISDMVHDLVRNEKIQPVSEFPIRQEQQRGLLRVFGRGEGLDQDIRQTSSKHDAQTDQAMMEVNDEYSDAPSPMPTGEAWGQVGGLGMLAPNSDSLYKNGVVSTDGLPEFDRQRVQQYVQSFKDNILNMHPILIPKELDAMVTVFLQSIPPQPVKSHMKPASKFVGSSGTSNISSMSETSGKRKRSPASDEQNVSITYQKPGLPYRSIHHALVLAVLALGKICLYRDKIPDVVPDQDQPVQNSPSVRNGIPAASPVQGSPPGLMLQSQTSGLPSPKENERALPSRRPSFQGPGASIKGAHNFKRNLDAIPGLDYFGLALDIFGSHVGGHSLRHVHVALFLGLYHGQLGRVLESWSYIALAGRTLQVVLRPSLSRLVNLNPAILESRRDNQLVFAYWTCLQLESDILAELPMPQSGILSYEDTMPYPNLGLQPAEGYSAKVTSNYIAQLYLRKRLNQIHHLLYSRRPQDREKTMEEKVLHLQDTLKAERHNWIPKGYNFSDNDPPANDILGARLRAKYWGSQVILYRPFIDMILRNEKRSDAFRHPPPHQSQWALQGIDVADVDVPPHIDPRALSYARLGMAALVESTQAFHGLDRRQRIIVTNVFTTAHAQWGNLLVLAACYRHPTLSNFITSDLLRKLFNRTIEFFKMIAHESSPLTADMNILVGLAQSLGFHQDDSGRRTSSSYSSITSVGQQPQVMSYTGDYPGTPTMPPPPHGMP